MYYSSTMSMQFSTLAAGFCMIFFSRDVGGQQSLPLNAAIEQTDCQSGSSNDFVANADRIIIQGTIPKKDPANWPVYLPVESTLDRSSYQTFCTIDALNEGCRDLRTTDCYCKSNTSSGYDIVVNQTLPLGLNGAYLRVSWTDLSALSTEVFFTGKLNVYPSPSPKMCYTPVDVTSSGECLDLLSQNLTVNLNLQNLYSLNFSVSGLTNPHYSLSLDGIVVDTSENDFLVTQKKFNISVQVEVTLFFQEKGGCRRNGSYIIFLTFTVDLDCLLYLLMPPGITAAGFCIIGLSVYGDNRNWYSRLKHKSEGDNVCEADKEINRLPPLNSPPPASANGTKPKPTATTTSDEDRTKKKRKKNKVTGGESEKKNTEKETPEKETPEERKTPEKKQRKTKKAGESDEGAEQTDQVRPLPSPRTVGEPGFNTSSTSPVNLRSNFSASLAHQGIKSDTRPPSIEVTTRALPKPKKK